MNRPFRGIKAFLWTWFAVYICLSATSAWAQQNQQKQIGSELSVAAAADLSTVLKEIGDAYEKRTGVTIKLSFAASGALTQQIQNGAPFDLFFSADMDYPRYLRDRAPRQTS